MKVSELKAYVEAQVPYKYVMNSFHVETPDNCSVVVLGSAGRSDRNTGALQFQFIIRNTDPEQAEKIAHDVFNHFNNKTNYVVGTSTVVFSRGQQAVPIYTGMDENSRHIYSVNIEAIVDNQ